MVHFAFPVLSYSSQHISSAELRYVVATLAEGLKLFQPELFKKSQFFAIVNLSPFAGRKLVYYLEGKVIAPELIPIGLERFVRVNPVLQLEFVPVDGAVQIPAGGQKHLVGEVVSYDEDPHRPRGLLVVLLKLFPGFLHFSSVRGIWPY